MGHYITSDSMPRRVGVVDPDKIHAHSYNFKRWSFHHTSFAPPVFNCRRPFFSFSEPMVCTDCTWLKSAILVGCMWGKKKGPDESVTEHCKNYKIGSGASIWVGLQYMIHRRESYLFKPHWSTKTLLTDDAKLLPFFLRWYSKCRTLMITPQVNS